jgi:hypothetical protein
MKTWIALLLVCLGLTSSAQNITYRQLVPLSNYVDSVNASKLNKTNDTFWGSFFLGDERGSSFKLSTNSPYASGDQGWQISVNNGGIAPDDIVLGYSGSRSEIYIGSVELPLEVWSFATFKGQSVFDSFVAMQNGLSVNGGISDNLGDLYVTTLSASNNVRVIAGSGVTVNAAEVSPNIMGYTINAVGGSGASNAVSILTTNNVIVSSSTTGLGFANTPNIVVAGSSNNSTATISFDLSAAYRAGVTSLVTSATQELSYAVQPASANLTNWSALSTNVILIAASNRVVVLSGSNTVVTLNSTNGTNYYVVSSTAAGGLFAALSTNMVRGAGYTNPAFYLDTTASDYTFNGRPISAYANSMIMRSLGSGASVDQDQNLQWTFASSPSAQWTFNVLSNSFVLNNTTWNAFNNSSLPKTIIALRDNPSVSFGYRHNSITNFAPVFNSSNMSMSGFQITNVSAINYGVLSAIVPANLTVDFATNKQYLTVSSATTLTNFSGLGTGKGADVTLILLPTGANRAVTYPTLGGNSFGIRAFTNANSPMWTTLTQNIGYAISISAFGTNTFWAITEWK